jgi:hypothetical protein
MEKKLRYVNFVVVEYLALYMYVHMFKPRALGRYNFQLIINSILLINRHGIPLFDIMEYKWRQI